MSAKAVDPWAAVWVSVLTVGLGGCRQILDIDDRTEAPPKDPEPVPGVCGGFLYPNAECAQCMDGDCCDQLRECEDLPLCEAYQSCYLKCPSEQGSCRASCSWGSWLEQAGAAVHACWYQSCAAECQVACGGWRYPSDACEVCMNEQCCSQAATCAADAACTAHWACTRDCRSTECMDDCGQAYPDGTEPANAWRGCQENRCAEACKPGDDWRCIGQQFAYATPVSTEPINIGVHIRDFVTDVAVEGATVTACAPADVNCGTPFDSTTTDGQGWATLDVPISADTPPGFNGYFEVSGADLYPTLFAQTLPLVQQGQNTSLSPPGRDVFDVLASLLELPIDPARGHVVVQIWDCSNAGPAGVSFVADPLDGGASPFYFLGSLPSVSGTETDDSGMGGFANVAPGLISVTAQVNELAQEISRGTVLVRPATLSILTLNPTPAP